MTILHRTFGKHGRGKQRKCKRLAKFHGRYFSDCLEFYWYTLNSYN